MSDGNRKPSPQKMWATYNFGCLWGIGYTRKQSRDNALKAGGWRPDDWSEVKDDFQSYKVTVEVRT